MTDPYRDILEGRRVQKLYLPILGLLGAQECGEECLLLVGIDVHERAGLLEQRVCAGALVMQLVFCIGQVVAPFAIGPRDGLARERRRVRDL